MPWPHPDRHDLVADVLTLSTAAGYYGHALPRRRTDLDEFLLENDLNTFDSMPQMDNSGWKLPGSRLGVSAETWLYCGCGSYRCAKMDRDCRSNGLVKVVHSGRRNNFELRSYPLNS